VAKKSKKKMPNKILAENNEAATKAPSAPREKNNKKLLLFMRVILNEWR
jgi:hypothetical protein